MNIYASIAVCFIPLITVFVCLVLLVDNFQIKWGLLSCLLGLFAVVPIAAIQFGVQHLSFFQVETLDAVLIQALIINGLIEESIKMGLLFVLPAKKMNFIPFFACAFLCGLSVGCFESVIYLISGYENIGLRMITAVVIHTCCAGLSGAFVWSVRSKKVHCMPFIFAVISHGVYNYFAGFPSGIRYFSVAVILFALIECRVWYKNCTDSSIR